MPAFRIATWLAAALSCSASVARAQQPLGNDALRSEVIGSTVQIDAPLGYKIPMQFRYDGTVHGTAGGLSFYLGSATDQGRWWIANGKLCTRWERWFDREDNCITIRRQARDEFAWVNDKGKSGTGRVVERRPMEVASATDTAASRKAVAAAETGWVAGASIGRDTHVVPGPSVPSAPARSGEQPIPNRPATPPAQGKLAAAGARQPQSPPPATSARVAQAAPPAALGGPFPAKPAIGPLGKPTPSEPGKAVAAEGRSSKPAARTGEQHDAVKLMRVVNVDDDDELFVRAQPNAGAPIVGAIPPDGRGVRALGACQNAWCPVSFGGSTGWAHGAYLAIEGG